MADTKISALTSASALGGTEIFPGVQSAATVGVTATQIAAFVAGTANVFTTLQTFTIGAANTGVIASTGYSLTGSNATSMIDLAGTWNTSGAPTAIKLNITNTASTGAHLMDLQVGGAGVFRVSPAGEVGINLPAASTGFRSWKFEVANNSLALRQWSNGWGSASASIFYISTGSTFVVQTSGGLSNEKSFRSSTTEAIPAGGSQTVSLELTSTANFGVFVGSGAPSVSAAKGSLYLRSDGSTTNDRAYINTDGGTTWTALTTAA